jgi:hypothetical protein
MAVVQQITNCLKSIHDSWFKKSQVLRRQRSLAGSRLIQIMKVLSEMEDQSLSTTLWVHHQMNGAHSHMDHILKRSSSGTIKFSVPNLVLNLPTLHSVIKLVNTLEPSPNCTFLVLELSSINITLSQPAPLTNAKKILGLKDGTFHSQREPMTQCIDTECISQYPYHNIEVTQIATSKITTNSPPKLRLSILPLKRSDKTLLMPKKHQTNGGITQSLTISPSDLIFKQIYVKFI